MEDKITKDMALNEVLRKNPRASKTLREEGLHCIGCPVAGMESLEQGAKARGMSDGEIKGLVKKLNKKLEEKDS